MRMIQWSIIGDSFITFLHESKASEEAKRRGLVPSKRRGYYEDPAKPGTIVAKSERGGMRLAAVKSKDAPKKVSKKKAAIPTKKRPPTSRTKAVAAKASGVTVPKNIKDFSSAAEATHGLVSGETSVNRAGQDVAIRHMMDPRTGKPIDVSKEAGRGVAIKLINDRHKQLHPKVLQAVNMALSTKKGDASGTLAKKWLGELGELLALRDLLKEGTESYFLPASAQKNDLVIFSPVGDDNRDLKMAFVSVKSTKGGGEANELGANIAADFSKILGNKTMTIGRQNVSAFEYADRAMKMKRSMIKFFTQGKVGRNGISVKGINPRLLQIKPEKINHPTSKVGFSSQADFLKARVIDEKELAKFFKAYKEKLGESGVIGVQLAKNLQKKIAERRNIRRPDKFSVKDLDAWLTVELGRTLDETDTVAVAATDTMTARYAEGEGFVDTRIAVGEDVTKRTLEKAKERGLKLGKNGRPISGAQQVEMLMGLSQRTRALGKKDSGTAHLDGIINGTPTAKVQDIELSVSDYIDKIGFRRRTLDVPLGQR